MEIITKLETFQVALACPKCSEGTMQYLNYVYPTSPPKYPHACSNPACKHSMVIVGHHYPHIMQRPVKLNWFQRILLKLKRRFNVSTINGTPHTKTATA